MVASDLGFHTGVGYTYESDNGLVRSWIDHIICSHDASALISGIHAVHSGSILSDHYPLLFVLNVQSQYLPATRTSVPRHTHFDWSRVTSIYQHYCCMLSQSLVSVPDSVSNCTSAKCTHHLDALDSWAHNFATSLLGCASKCFPSSKGSSTKKLVGWRVCAGGLKVSGRFWYKI